MDSSWEMRPVSTSTSVPWRGESLRKLIFEVDTEISQFRSVWLMIHARLTVHRFPWARGFEFMRGPTGAWPLHSAALV